LAGKGKNMRISEMAPRITVKMVGNTVARAVGRSVEMGRIFAVVGSKTAG
jgi:hypothetical protein